MKEEPQQSQKNTENHGADVFAWGGKACGKEQKATKRPRCQRRTEGGPKAGLANLRRRKKTTEKALAGRRWHKAKWEVSI
jgi:hypothetical protein